MSGSMFEGERVQRLIYDWLGRNFPDGPTWYAKPAISPSLEIRMIPAFDDVEYNLGNGGWAQFLWNCFDYWREAIVVAKEGYRLIGATEQSVALDTLWALCERDERECGEMLDRSEAEVDEERYGTPPFFAEFTSRSYAAPTNDWEPLFYSNSGVYEKRLAWLVANEAHLRNVIGLLD